VLINPDYSTADTNDVVFPKIQTYNFTGLIGDARYEIEIAQADDEKYEGKETVFFELGNLSGGNFGDFVSHAAIIHDNELPDVQIADVSYSGNELLDYIEIKNSENLQVSLSDWEIKSKSFSYTFSNEKLKAGENRRLYYRDLVIQNRETTWISENSGTLELLNEHDEIISLKQYQLNSNPNEENVNSITESVPALSSNPVEIPTTTSFAQPQNVSANSIEEPESEPDSAWLTVAPGDIRNYSDYDLFYWNEKKQGFELVEFMDSDSLLGYTIFALNRERTDDDPILSIAFDTIRIPVEVSIQPVSMTYELSMLISATDSDGNGQINNAEGFNFFRNESDFDLPVREVLTQIEDQLFEHAIHPFVYTWPEDGTGWKGMQTLDKTQSIPANTSFWLKADSVITETELLLQFDNSRLAEPVMEEPGAEPNSLLALKLNSESQSRIISLYLFENEEELLPEFSLEPTMNPELYFSEAEYLNFGFHQEGNWTKTVSAVMEEDRRLVFPIAFSAGESSRMEISVQDWEYLPSDWIIYLEDTETGERIEVDQSLSFEFEYQFEPIEPEQEKKLVTQKLPARLIQKYNLVLVPPGVEESLFDEPDIIALYQNYPNPFNPVTTISFYLPEAEEVKLSVFNVVGQPVAVLTNGTLSAGEHHYDWDATGFPSGMYIYQLEIKNQIMTRKMTLVK
ncbi:MAG: T9SS type A sorting domain-containing protein, partial [Balneolales bacterium]|nr:T9SS type A sorting domain-containing protein [Balneolales bacterium]